QREASVAREAWMAQTQLLAVARSDRAVLAERIREIKRTLARSPDAAQSALWSTLQTNQARLSPELRERTLDEVGLNWQTSPDVIVVTKESVRGLGMEIIRRSGQLSDSAAAVLALTPVERSQVEAALARVKTDLKDWALARVERREPAEEVLVDY